MIEFTLPSSALQLTLPYLRASLAGDRSEALRIALEEGLRRGVSAPELQLRMILPAQREVGRLWQENQITVAQEHLATSVSQLVLSHLYAYLPRPQSSELRAVVACVPGELHDLGARMGADFLEMAGFEVHFLGASVALSELSRVIAEEAPHVLGLSATMHFHLPALRSTVAAVRSVAPGLSILLGGGLLESVPGLGEELGVRAASTDATELAHLRHELMRCSEATRHVHSFSDSADRSVVKEPAC